MRLFLPTLLCVGLMLHSNSYARPVSYPGGWTFMTMNNGVRNSAHIHYSPTAKISLGVRHEDWKNRDFSMTMLQANILLKRWNKKYSQANLYLKTGLGTAKTDLQRFTDDRDTAGFVGFAADWEDRRYFISYENRFTDAGKFDDFFQQSVQAGWAPYQGDYGDLHTWLMLRIDHQQKTEDKLIITPLIRLFKGVHLLEAGVSDNSKLLLNYIYRY